MAPVSFLARALAPLLLFTAPTRASPASSAFVPAFPSTDWLLLSALRRPGFPYVLANLPAKTTVAPLAYDGACGFTPPTRDVGCFPAILNWLFSAHTTDRNDAFLRLLSTPSLLTPYSLARQPAGAQLLPTGVPGDVLLAKQLARTVRQRLPVCDPGANSTPARAGGDACEQPAASPWDAQLGDAHDRWRAAPPAFSGVAAELFVDTRDAWRPASSPRVVAQGAAGAGRLLFTKGIPHSTDARLQYPTLTAFQYIFMSPRLSVLAELLNATCFCAPSEPICWHAWLCLVLDTGVLTLLAPDDAGWGALTGEALHLLFTDRAAGYLTIAHHILGPAVFSKSRPFLDPLGRARAARRLSESSGGGGGGGADASRRLGDTVNRRLASLAQRRSARDAQRDGVLQAATDAVAAAAAAAAAGGDPDAQQQQQQQQQPQPQELVAVRARLLALGEAGEQSLAGFSEAGGTPPGGLADTLLWRSAPGVLPLSSYLYLAQLKDTLRVAGPVLLKTFSSLVVANHTPGCNASARVDVVTVNSTGGEARAPWPAPPAPVPAGGPPDDPEALIRPVRTNESELQRAHEAAGGLWALGANATLDVSGPCADIRPARLIASLGDPFPCKPRCARCDGCTADCGGCRAAYGYGSPSCATRCACAAGCDGCTSCRWAFPLAWRRLAADGSQSGGGGEGDGGDDAGDGDDAGGGSGGGEAAWVAAAAAAASGGPSATTLDAAAHAALDTAQPLPAQGPRGLWGADECLRITFTGTERPFRSATCDLWEPTNAARTLCGCTDIETLNGVIHVIDRPLLPPPVLLALYAAGATPFSDGPLAGDPLPECPFEPADAPAALPFLARAEFFE